MNNTISDIDIDLTAVCEAEDDAAQAEAQPAQNESDDTYAQKMQEQLALARSSANCRYIGIDLHSNNIWLSVIVNEQRPSGSVGKVIFSRSIGTQRVDGTLPEDLIKPVIERFCKDQPHIACVEATYNWYWLADLFERNGWNLVLADPSTVSEAKTKAADDRKDAEYLADRLRYNALRYAVIMPKQLREIRDLVRTRGTAVKQRAREKIIVINKLTNLIGRKITGKELRELIKEHAEFGTEAPMLLNWGLTEEVRTILDYHLTMATNIDQGIQKLEEHINAVGRNLRYTRELQKMPGCGPVISSILASEIGSIRRFATAANFVSYCRLASTSKLSNGKSKGLGNAKNGNAYLSWAFTELATLMVRYSEAAKRHFEKLMRKYGQLRVKAIRVLAAKLARSVYQCLSKNEPFDVLRCF
ncbi:IS110 family transposase [uncultured Sutterella sp.]|jgi:transposase|uniref:IS110 family transposase n=1 Tax=uncultured Sutterella sp. TaxID=286133 RepID=UPI00280B000E|nr:IS110 family transposase [uncultured Sutterella sp.]